MDNKQNQKPRRWLKIASYIGFGLLALETALLVGAGVVACSDKGKETIASDGVRVTSPVVEPPHWLVPVEGATYNGSTWEFANNLGYDEFDIDMAFTASTGGSYSNFYASMGGGDFSAYFYSQATNSSTKVYSDDNLGWINQGYRTITLTAEPSSEAVTFLFGHATLVSGSESSSEASNSSTSSDSVDTETFSEVTFNLPSTYDFRRWVANVDPATGCLSLESRWDNGIGFRNFVFPLDWTAGDGKRYNYIYLNVVGLGADQTLIVNGNGDAKIASNVFGSNWDKFSMLMTIRFGYAPNYNGEYIQTYNDIVSIDVLNPSYYADVYRNTLVSGSLDGQGVSAFDCRSVVVPAMYRYFEVFQDSASAFSTPNYSNVTTGELLNMDLNAVVVLGDISTSPMSMLTQGFNAIASILSIQLLPNVTLGLLLFIPLIVTVILVIVRLLQK